MSTQDDGTTSGVDKIETRGDLFLRIGVATQNLRVVQQTVHRIFHHEQHTTATCPMESCVWMRAYIDAWPGITEIMELASEESKEARAMVVDGKRHRPKTHTSTGVRRTPVDV